MRHETGLLVDAVARLLRDRWPMEQAALLAQSAAERQRIWTALSELGLSLLGSADAGGIASALPVISRMGEAHCPAPVPEVAVLSIFAERCAAGFAEEFRREGVLPAFSPGALSSTAGTASVRMSESAIFGHASTVDALGATHLATIADHGNGDLSLAWIDLSDPSVAAHEQLAFGEAGWLRMDFAGVRTRCFPVARPEAEELVLLWRFLLAVRATGALKRAQCAVVDHVKHRRQFGVPIGSFQAIQHKLADIQIALDGALRTQAVAADSFDADTAAWRYEALAAIAAADPALRTAMLQVHHALGAIGYSEEHEAARHFRRIHLDLARADGGTARQMLASTLAGQPRPLPPETHLGDSTEAFRAEVRQWLTTHWTEAQRAAHAALPLERQGSDKAFSRAMGEMGWIALTWPKAYGGRARSQWDQLALVQECARARAPTTAHIAAATLIAPALLAFGTEEQKMQFLPRIARGELTICLGYSEPEAGSDLASLRTRAIRDGDDWVISGQKMWGTTTDVADYVWLAARTDPDAPKHAGISVFLLPLSLPGITVRPSKALYGRTFSTQFYDEVRVPSSALVGGLNEGWKVITGALANERVLLGGSVTQVACALGELIGLLRDEGRLHACAADRVGALAADLAVATSLLMQCVELTESGRVVHAEAAMSKTFSAELMERFAETALDLIGPLAGLSAGAVDSVLDGSLERLLRTGPMHVIGGGANEIQRSLIAQRGLGLPR